MEINTEYKFIYILGNDLLQDVFENILINSIVHNNNRKITISILISEFEEKEVRYYKLEFIDNGVGIEDSRKEKVLYRIDPDSNITFGMGLGLSLVRQIITNYSGKILIKDAVEGNSSRGTNVILLIPKINGRE